MARYDADDKTILDGAAVVTSMTYHDADITFVYAKTLPRFTRCHMMRRCYSHETLLMLFIRLF